MTKPTKWVCAQQRLRCPVWSKSSLCAQWVAKDSSFLHVGALSFCWFCHVAAHLSIYLGCPTPTAPTNGNFQTPEGTAIGRFVYYTCDSTYSLVGENFRECLADTTWNGNTPLCLKGNVLFRYIILYKPMHPRDKFGLRFCKVVSGYLKPYFNTRKYWGCCGFAASIRFPSFCNTVTFYMEATEFV